MDTPDRTSISQSKFSFASDPRQMPKLILWSKNKGQPIPNTTPPRPECFHTKLVVLSVPVCCFTIIIVVWAVQWVWGDG